MEGGVGVSGVPQVGESSRSLFQPGSEYSSDLSEI